MKTYIKTLGLSGVALLPLAVSQHAAAAGFQLNEHSVTGIGRAYAGETAVGDTAAVIARNPAAMSLFDKRSLSAVLHYIDPAIDVEGYNTSLAYDASKEDVAPSEVVPGFYYVSPINDQLAWGLAVNSNFGLSTDYGSGYAGSEFAQKTSIKTYNLTPSISVQFTDSFSVGLGVSYIYGEGEITSTASAATATYTGSAISEGTTLLDLEGDGDRFGWNLGMLWQMDENSRIGFRYQAAVDLVLDGDMSMFVTPLDNPLVTPPGTVMDFTGSLTINLPEVWEVGYFRQLNDQWSVMASVVNSRWSSFQSLTADIDGVGDKLLKEEKWTDAWTYSLGAEVKLSELTTLRFGYGVDESPVQDEYRSLTIPDADRTWYSVGASFNLQNSGSIDMAVLYIDGDSVEVDETFKTYTNFHGELDSMSVMIYSIGYNYSY